MADSSESLRTPFEQEFDLLPLGDDRDARIERVESLLAGYLRASIDHSRGFDNFHTIRYREVLPLPTDDTIVRLLDGFRDPVKVQARKDDEQQEIEDQHR
jgi:hypothetical protein